MRATLTVRRSRPGAGRFEIRRATASDIPPLLGLAREYWSFEGINGFDDAVARRALELYFTSPQYGSAWIAFDGPMPIGYLIGCYVFSLEHGGMTAELDEFFVRESARGDGAGSKLLESAEVGFRKDGCTSVFMEVGHDNDDASRFYMRHGYAPREKYRTLTKPL
jgi:ribosomal protein S18 acetylase RimI-like enzyme